MGNLPDINEDGSEVVVALLSMRYGCPDDDEYDTIDEAKRAAEWLVDCNSAAPVAIVVDGDLKLYNRYRRTYEWVLPNAGEAALVRKNWPQFFQPKGIESG